MITREAYEQIRAVNWSTLTNLDVSPLLYKHRLTNPEPGKAVFAIGNAAHCLTLEPEKFDARYAVFDGTRRGEKWDAWQEEHPGVESLKPHELETARAVAKAVRSHRIAARILKGGRREEVVTWTDPETGLACKGRLDYLRPDFLIDLKTARDPGPRFFLRDAIKYGYVSQVAWYHDGAVAARLIPGGSNPYIIAVEKEEPFDVAVYQLDDEALAFGRSKYRRLMRRLVECIEADYWPGVAPDVVPLRVPAWALDQALSSESKEEDF
jgi:exodeoxyribonuclease VIII